MAGEFGWTVVQHSGYGYSAKPGFEHAVETRHISTQAERHRVEGAGGVIFDTCMAAEDFAEAANYPAGNPGIYPRAKGTFSDKLIDGLLIYIPTRNAVG